MSTPRSSDRLVVLPGAGRPGGSRLFEGVHHDTGAPPRPAVMNSATIVLVVIAAAIGIWVGGRWRHHTRTWSDHRNTAALARDLAKLRWKTLAAVLVAALVAALVLAAYLTGAGLLATTDAPTPHPTPSCPPSTAIRGPRPPSPCPRPT